MRMPGGEGRSRSGRGIGRLVLGGLSVAFAVVLLCVLPATGQTSVAPVITSIGLVDVDEGATSIAALAATTDDDTPQADLVWSVAGGADSAGVRVERVGCAGVRLSQGL